MQKRLNNAEANPSLLDQTAVVPKMIRWTANNRLMTSGYLLSEQPFLDGISMPS